MSPAIAQIVPDASLGAESSVVTQPEELMELIEGGAVRGTNLFHSFSEFNVGDTQQVYFANPNGISNILSRVTGDNISEIFGTLGVRGGANLFLLNPNGIFFGENASLDLNGSFLATTANSFEFENDLSYAATNPNLPPLLAVNIPIGLQFGANTEAIEVRGTGHNLILTPRLTVNRALREPGLGLQVAEDKTLALIGGDLNLDGANLTASAGKIVLGSVEQSAAVGMTAAGDELAFDFQNSNAFGDIQLTRASSLDLSGDRAGSLQLQGKNIRLDNSAILANTGGAVNGGKLSIEATEKFELVGDSSNDFPSAILTQVVSGATGNGSEIEIVAGEFQLQDNAVILSSTDGSGDGGIINLQADRAELSNTTERAFGAGTGLISRVGQTGTGKGGDIQLDITAKSDGNLDLAADAELITPGTLRLQGGAKITLLTNGAGMGGNLSLQAEQLDIVGSIVNQLISSEINTEVSTAASNDGGDLNLAVNNLNLIDGGQISSNTGSNGSGGDIAIEAGEISIVGFSSTDNPHNLPSSITTSAAIGNTRVTGNEGNLTIVSDRLNVTDGGFISSETKGLGDSGDLQIDTNILALASGGQIRSENNGLGNSGKLLVNAQSASIIGDYSGQASGIFTSITRIVSNETANEDLAELRELATSEDLETERNSNLTINSSKLQVQNGGAIISSTSGIADAENLKLAIADTLAIEDGARVGSFTSGTGNAGNLQIEVGNSLKVGISEDARAAFDGDNSTQTRPGSLFSRVENNAAGNGGEINVKALDLELNYGGSISANTAGKGDAGDIILNAENITVQNSVEIDGVRSGISSGVESSGLGNGGEIELNVDRNLLVSQGGSIGVDARSANIDPEIEIAAGSINIQAGNIIIEAALEPETVAEFAQSNTLTSRISAFSEGSSNSGDVRIAAEKLSIIDTAARSPSERAGILVRNKDAGSAGNIALDVGELILAGGQLNAEVNSGTRGNVSLNTDNISITAQGGINTQASGNATSGNIDIVNSGNIFLEDSEIVADAARGNAGNIQIDTVGLFRDRDSEISASSELGIDGVVALNTSFDAVRNVGAAFPQKPLDPDLSSQQSCETSDDKDNFAYIGRGGLPVNPFDRLAEEDLLVDWQQPEIAAESANLRLQPSDSNYNFETAIVLNAAEASSEPELKEAQAWQLNSAGRVELIAATGKPALSELGNRCQATN